MIISGNGIYQKVIKDNENLELYLAMTKAKFKEKIPENVFDNNNIIITIVNGRNIEIKTNIGNLKYYYENNQNYNYTVHLYVASKIINTNCIYNIDNEKIKQEANLKELNDQYNKNVNNIDTSIFLKVDETTQNTNKDQISNTQITTQQADDIAEKGFKEAERIVGQYSKDTQEITTEYVYANNFFTRKSNETDIVYNNEPKVKCYVYTRTDDMLNGVSIYIDINTGKIIGGRAFGD